MLRDTQISLATSLLEGSMGALSQIRAGKLSAEKRLDVYRHNVFSNLRGALKDIYPVVLGVVGEAFFIHAADQFVLSHPSRSGDLFQFGSEFAAFIQAYPHAAELPYLADVARLEWAWHEAFHAGDSPLFDLRLLAAITAEEHGQLRFILHPTARLIESPFPLLRIWEVNQPDYAGGMNVEWDEPADTLLVRRDASDGVSVLIERVAAGSFAFLSQIQQGATLESATAAALGIDAAFDLQAFLLDAFRSGVVVGIARK